MRLATEWGVLRQAPVRLGLPDRDPGGDRNGAEAVNDPIAGTKLPPVPLEKIEELIERDPLPLLGLERPGG